MTNSALTVERVGAVDVLHIDDGKANAFSKSLIADIMQAISAAEQSDDVAAIVLHGRPGRLLSGGFDLGVMKGGDNNAITDLVADGGDLVRRLYGSNLPVVAACTGHAVAAGALVLLGCDLRIGAAGDFNIGLPEVRIKMSLPAWAVSIGVERLSRRHLQRALAHGRLTDPATAVDVGFLDEVVDGDAVLEHAIAAAAELAEAVYLPAYEAIVKSVRGSVLDQMAAEIQHDRDHATPIVANETIV